MGKTTSRLVLSVLLLCMVSMLVFSGCTQGAENEATTGSTQAASATTKATQAPTAEPTVEPTPEEPYAFSIFRSTWTDLDDENDLVVLELNELLNIDIEILTAPYESWEEKFNVLMASGQVPDLSVTTGTGWSNFNSWCEQGLFLDITDLYAQYCPNIQQYVDDDLVKKVSINGKLYGVPRPQISTSAVLFRTDWLEAVGLDMPTTISDLDEVMRAFTFDDPDGNGVDDTYGLITTSNLAMCVPIMMAYGLKDDLSNGYSWYVTDDGTLASTLTQPEAKEFIAYLAELYAEGIMDPEWMLTEDTAWQDKFIAGKGGWCSAQINGVAIYGEQMREIDPDADLDAVLYIESDEGVGTRCPSNGYYMMSSISGKAENPVRILEFLDYLMTEDGYNLIVYGVEGITYNIVDGEIVRDDEAAEANKVSGAGYRFRQIIQIPIFSTGLPADDERDAKYTAMFTSEILSGYIDPAPPCELPSQAEVTAMQGADYVLNMLTEMICGNVDVEENWDSFIQEWWETGGEQLTAEINEVYQASLGN